MLKSLLSYVLLQRLGVGSTDIVYFPPLFKENNVANNLETICDTFMSPLLNVDIGIHVEL